MPDAPRRAADPRVPRRSAGVALQAEYLPRPRRGSHGAPRVLPKRRRGTCEQASSFSSRPRPGGPGRLDRGGTRRWDGWQDAARSTALTAQQVEPSPQNDRLKRSSCSDARRDRRAVRGAAAGDIRLRRHSPATRHRRSPATTAVCRHARGAQQRRGRDVPADRGRPPEHDNRRDGVVGRRTSPSGYPVPDVLNHHETRNYYVPQYVSSDGSSAVDQYEQDLTYDIYAVGAPAVGDATRFLEEPTSTGIRRTDRSSTGSTSVGMRTPEARRCMRTPYTTRTRSRGMPASRRTRPCRAARSSRSSRDVATSGRGCRGGRRLGLGLALAAVLALTACAAGATRSAGSGPARSYGAWCQAHLTAAGAVCSRAISCRSRARPRSCPSHLRLTAVRSSPMSARRTSSESPGSGPPRTP